MAVGGRLEKMLQQKNDAADKMLQPLLKALPVGPAQVEMAKGLQRSKVIFGIGAAILGCYAFEWKLVLQYLPYYNGKYKE